MILRDYQQRDVDRIRDAIRRGKRKILYVLPTGGGKTLVMAAIVQSAYEKGNSNVLMAPRRELVYQASARLESIEHDHGIIMAKEMSSLMPSTQVVCIPTLHARAFRSDKIHPPPAKVVHVDEAHIGIGGRAHEIVDYYADEGAIVIGYTATPVRTDGVGLGEIYDEMIVGPTVQELVDESHLVPPRYFTGMMPDLSGVKVQAGDYNQKQLGERVDDDKLIGDVVSNYLRHASDRQGFVFCVNVAHSVHVCEAFTEAGIEAEHIDGTTKLKERKAILRRLEHGATQVVCNCEVMTYGVDYPPVSAISLAKPTKSLGRYIQMVGRGLRTHTGKADCIVLDHGRAIENLGFVEDPQPWSLDGKEKIQDRKAKPENKEPKEIECPECMTVFRPSRYCPGCGQDMHQQYKRAIEAHEADLEEIDKKTRQAKKREWTHEDKKKFFAELKGYCEIHGNKPGRAVHLYEEKIGALPFSGPAGDRVYDAPPEPPSAQTIAWVKSRNIAYAKRRRA